MNDLVSFGGGLGLPSRENLAKNLAASAQSIPLSAGGAQFLKMDKGNGEWVFGQEETLVEEDSLWAVNPASLMHGWVAWDTDSGGAPVQEIMVSINRPLPAQGTLPPLGVGKNGKQLEYQQQRSVQIVCIEGDDKGTVCEYKQSSVGAMKLFSKLTNDLLTQLDADPDAIVAIIRMESESYKHKKYGRIYNPVWAVQEWRSISDTSAPAAAEEGDEAAPPPPPAKAESAAAPRQRTAAKAAPAPAPDPVEEEEALAREYEQAAAETQAPRRRLRR